MVAQNEIASGNGASLERHAPTFDAAVPKAVFGILPHQCSRPSMAAFAVGRHPCRPLAARVRIATRPGSALAPKGLGAHWRPRSFCRASMPGLMGHIRNRSLHFERSESRSVSNNRSRSPPAPLTMHHNTIIHTLINLGRYATKQRSQRAPPVAMALCCCTLDLSAPSPPGKCAGATVLPGLTSAKKGWSKNERIGNEGYVRGGNGYTMPLTCRARDRRAAHQIH